MFSISIIDERMKKIFLIRDRFGIKPLYYHVSNQNNEITYCSEIEPLFENKRIHKALNENELYKNLEYGIFNSTNETWFKNIKQIPLGIF